MDGLRRVVGWLSRQFALYVLLVLFAIAVNIVWPWARPRLDYVRQQQDIGRMVGDLDAARRQATLELDAARESASRQTLAAIDQQRVRTARALKAARKKQRSSFDRRLSMVKVDVAQMEADARIEIEIAYLQRKLDGLTATREQITRKQSLDAIAGELLAAEASLARKKAELAAANARCADAHRRAGQHRIKTWVSEHSYGTYLSAELKDRNSACAAAAKAKAVHDEAERRHNRLKAAGDAASAFYKSAVPWAKSSLSDWSTEVERHVATESATWYGKALAWARSHHVDRYMVNAAYVLAGIILLPFAIRLGCYFVLAPIAMRRPAIRLAMPGMRGSDIPLAEPSSTSVTIRLGPGEELLVRQGYLQTTSQSGTKATKWFLDNRFPITSWATGLTFLTRISGEGEATTVSAVDNPFAEVTILTLPEGAACVLQPRALAAVVRPAGQRLRIERRWRLFSLNAWLTLQLRYFLFHGPARLVVKGGRGIRVERAERGRIFAQDQLVGFSADLDYAITRNETFWPYFFGREPLLKDRVQAGDGILVIEEAPMAGRPAGKTGGGIENAVDMILNLFGMKQ